MLLENLQFNPGDHMDSIVGVGLKILGGTALVCAIAEAVSSLKKNDENGFDRNGFDRDGYDAAGFNTDGFDRKGYDRNGRDRSGYDRDGFDINGFDIEGYGKDGYNRKGYDREGFARNNYNSESMDRANHCRQYYADRIQMLRERLAEAEKQSKYKIRYAIQDIRSVFEEGLKYLVLHSDPKLENGTAAQWLNECRKKKLLGDDEEIINKLHCFKSMGNNNAHNSFDISYSRKNVRDAIDQVSDFLNRIESILVYA